VFRDNGGKARFRPACHFGAEIIFAQVSRAVHHHDGNKSETHFKRARLTSLLVVLAQCNVAHGVQVIHNAHQTRTPKNFAKTGQNKQPPLINP
jgi:hypothetical protein